MAEEPAWSIGIEEEYLLVERESGALITEQPSGILEKVADLHHGLVARELFSSQLEIGTGICTDFKHLRADVGLLRLAVTEAAAEFGLAPIAASSHPFARLHQQKVTKGERYQALAEDLQGVTRRLVISGLHVHVGIEDPDLRVDLMGQVAYFLPHLLALSTSSPFWEGRDTGLKSYRMAVFRTLPRTGLPEKFDSWSEFRRHVDVLVRAGVIEDSSKVWWDIRPSERYPTLEMRVTDLPTRMEDTVAVAAMYVCLLRMLWRLKLENRRWRSYANFLVSENLWRAQRYGISDCLIDFGTGEMVPLPDLVEEIIELVQPDAEALDCVAEVEHARTICERGTSADRQLAVYREALAEGATDDEALNAVVQAPDLRHHRPAPDLVAGLPLAGDFEAADGGSGGGVERAEAARQGDAAIYGGCPRTVGPARKCGIEGCWHRLAGHVISSPRASKLAGLVEPWAVRRSTWSRLLVLSMRPLLARSVWCQARISSDHAMKVSTMSWYSGSSPVS